MKEKIADMEERFKLEATARADLISKLENNIEGQMKTLQNQVRKEEIGRAQQELVLKSDITKLAEQLRTDYELFKSQQNQLTEKITEMIKLEVDTRLASDKENRGLTEASVKRMVEELTLFKEAVEKQNKRFAKDLKEANAENSERANFLSRYVDDQIKKVDESTDEQLKKVKLLCARLTEQVKEHFQNNEIAMGELRNFTKKFAEDTAGDLGRFRSDFDTTISDLSVNYEVKAALDSVELQNLYQLLSSIAKSTDEKIGQLSSQSETMQKTLLVQEQNCATRNEKAVVSAREETERKIATTLERMKKESADQWATSLKMAEGYSTRAGMQQALNVAPIEVMPMGEIKSALGQLGADMTQPRPKLALGESHKPVVQPESEKKPSKDAGAKEKAATTKAPTEKQQPPQEEKKQEVKKQENTKPEEKKPEEEKKQEPPAKKEPADEKGAAGAEELLDNIDAKDMLE